MESQLKILNLRIILKSLLFGRLAFYFHNWKKSIVSLFFIRFLLFV